MKHNAMIHCEGFSVIRHVKGMYDVFFGKGYTEHARIRMHWNPNTNRKTIEHLEGITLTPYHKHLLYKGI